MEVSLNLLALDVGERRIGVAIANSQSRLSKPLKTLLNTEKVVLEISKLVKDEDIKFLIIGLPRNLSGEDTQQTESVRHFSDKLSDQLDIPFFFEDETLSSKRAEQILNDSTKPYKKEDIDAMAACLILDDFMNNNPEVING